jgi:restriction endonuclease Mrr
VSRHSHAGPPSLSRSTTPNDGTELAKLMIAHGVGVTPVAVYELKRVDSDFFAED